VVLPLLVYLIRPTFVTRPQTLLGETVNWDAFDSPTRPSGH
jgi:hypothetical protein